MKQIPNNTSLPLFISKIKNLQTSPIAVIGDVMLDHYIYGSVERISPEAPVPILNVEYEKYTLGGAANVANNLRSLGASTYLVGIVGKDKESTILKNLLQSQKINFNLIEDEDYVTITKTRLIAKNQQLLRIDREKITPVKTKNIRGLLSNISDTYKIIVVSDYGKGTITKSILDYLTETKRKILIDPKKRNYEYYKNIYLITPNKKEAEELSEIRITDEKDVVKAGLKIIQKTNSQNLLITLGSRGMVLFEKQGEIITHLPALARNVYDVTGAGDTVMASIALGLAKGISLLESCVFANICAGIVVSKLGTSVPTWEELEPSNGMWNQYLKIESWNIQQLS